MRKKFLYLLSALALTATISAGTLMLAGCGPDGQTENLTDEPLKATTTVADWSEGEPGDEIFESNGWGNGGVFNTYWSSSNVSYENNVAKLTIAENTNPTNEESEKYDYLGGEMRTYGYYGYGDYEVRMKPAKKAGTASTFFTCTGDYDTNPNTGEKNPWDEIDIEFLGNDTTKVQFNYFVNSVGGHEYMYDLGFDASEEFHTYGFRWAEDYITWFVDGEPVYRVDATESNPIPSTAGRMLMNYWCGNSEAEGWMGKYSNPGDEGPEYQWIKTSAKVDWTDPSKPKPPEEVDPIVPDGEVIEIDLGKEGVEAAPSKDVYTVDVKDGKLNVKYNNLVGGYENVQINGITEDIQANNVFTAKITNNGTATANVRVNIFANAVVNGAATSEASNLSATQDGVAVRTDTEWGGSFFTIDAGKTIEIVVIYDTERTSTAVQFMLDSHMGDSTARSGDITISDMTLFTQADGEGETPEEPEEPVTPPTVSDEPANIDLSNATIGGNLVAAGGPYTATVTDGKLNISYANMAGGTWNNVDLSGFAADMADHNVFTATIKNNGTASVNLRVDIMGGTVKLNASATMDGEAVNTDLVNGGSYFVIGAGEEVVIEIVYTLGDAAPTSIQFMPDSHVWQDTNSYTGNITVSNLVLKAAK